MANGGQGEGAVGADTLKKLLKWSAAKAGETPSEDVQSASQLTEGSKQFFWAAVENMKGVDIPKRMGDIGRCVESCNEEEQEDLLDELAEHAEKLDHANDLDTVGGMDPCFNLIRQSPSPQVRANALAVLAAVAQNNPRGQETLLAKGAARLLVDAFHAETKSAPKAQSLTALGCLARNHAEAGKQVLEAGGVSAAISAMNLGPSDVRCARKGAQLARYYAQRSEEAIKAIVEQDALAKAGELVGCNDAMAREQAVGLLVDVSKHADFKQLPQAIDQLRSESVSGRVAARRREMDGLSQEEAEACQDERLLCDEFLSMLRHGGQF